MTPINTAADYINKSKINGDEILNDLDQETIDMFGELDKYLIESADRSIKLNVTAAELEDVRPELLNVINIVNDMGDNLEVENEVMNTLGFKYPIGNYGRYCGKGNKGGKPIDNLDKACQAHDRCFLGFKNKSTKNKECNQRFVRALLPIIQANSELTKKGAYARAAAYLFTKHM
ncbi:phospholipase A2 family protein [Virgibacillus dokdonensis]|nr:phospholipase A2 family protein [Virgibacillus dokdonensis]